MKLLFFSQYFWPENFRINEIINFLKKNNKSTVLTSYPTYPNKLMFKNYNKLDDKKFLDLEIVRVPVTPRLYNNLSIYFNYLTFIISSFFFGLFVLIKKKIDIIFIFSPSPILSALPIIFLNKLFKKKVVIWILDLWPNTVVDLKVIKNKYVIKFLKFMTLFIYNNSDLILAQSRAMKNEIEKLTKTKCTYFPSWPEENIGQNMSELAKEIEIKKNNITRLMFTGNIGESHSFETLVKASIILKESHQVEWLIIGDGRWKKNLNDLIKKNKLQNQIKIYDSIPIYKIRSYFNHADALYLSLKENETFKKTIPGKLQTYMSSGKPIIGSISGEANNIILDAKCGFASNAEDYLELANNIKKFINLPMDDKKIMGLNGINYAKEHFNKEKNFNFIEMELNKLLK